ncbi:MAG: hypothetical protein RLZZ484_782, partial [Pseudomonadota bacterium]
HDHGQAMGHLKAWGLQDYVSHQAMEREHQHHYRLQKVCARNNLPHFDTLCLSEKFKLAHLTPAQALCRETVLALLASPVLLMFPSLDEFISAVRMRCHIVEAARRTAMDFHTERVDRPVDYWEYQEDKGFLLKPGKCLIEALQQATQPEVSGKLYAFSCYRATEYVILLGIALEARLSHPALLAKIVAQWQQQPIASGRFHDVFLHEWGSNEDPLPATWFVPGDRVWFRNPDDASSDIEGYEGSWVIYLGQGLFANFWQPQRPYDLQTKAIELFHWRHGVRQSDQGGLYMDEEAVAKLVQQTCQDPQKVRHITDRMLRLRDPKGVYAEGGCLDTTRESPRWVRPETTDIALPRLAH